MKNKKGCLGCGIIAVIVILIIVGVIAYTQRNNISALVVGANNSEEDIQQQISDNKKEIEQELENYNVSGLRDFTFEEEEAIRKGELTVDEALQKIMAESGNTQQQTGGQNAPAGQQSSASASSEENQATAIIKDYTVQLYGLKATYLGKIGNLVDSAKADHKNGMRSGAIMSKYIGTVASLEKEADSRVDSLLSELKGKLDAIGADTSIISTMRSAYQNEKALKKSYYLSLYNSKK